MACHLNHSQTFTEHPVGLYHRVVRQLHRPQGSPEGSAVCTTHHWGQTMCPPGHLHHPMSPEGQKDNQGQQPPEPVPVHPTIIQKARSVQVHQSWAQETEKQLLSQGHQTVKQPSLTERLLPTYRLKSLATLIKGLNKGPTSLSSSCFARRNGKKFQSLEVQN